ncbi:MAG: hypothetical protein HY420_04195 [Candidatus Kerfeldbacteria bacterium]|nr:hypothetical protein [Candidatus Kerfeldbacteria bacterium]
MEGESVRSSEALEAESKEILAGRIREALRQAAYDELGNHHLDALEFDDAAGHHAEHRVSNEEAEAIEQALWSAGGDTTIDQLVGQIAVTLIKRGFDLRSPDHLEVSVRVRSAS